MRFLVICSPGIGDLTILHIVSHHLKLAGHEVSTVTPHRFGKWLDGYQFGEIESPDAIFLQHDNSPASHRLREQNNVYSFFGAYNPSKHGPLKKGLDFVSNPNETIVDNVVLCLKELFGIKASKDNGLRPPLGLIHRRHLKRIAINAQSNERFRIWPLAKFEAFASWAKSQGFEPVFIPQFPSLEELLSFIYESGYFLGNDSGPAHLASCLKIPHLVIGKGEKHMRFWRPGWGYGDVITPPKWIPNWKGFRIRENYWNRFIFSKSVINRFNDMILKNNFI